MRTGVGAASATSSEFTYVKDQSIDTYSALTARALVAAIVGRWAESEARPPRCTTGPDPHSPHEYPQPIMVAHLGSVRVKLAGELGPHRFERATNRHVVNGKLGRSGDRA